MSRSSRESKRASATERPSKGMNTRVAICVTDSASSVKPRRSQLRFPQSPQQGRLETVARCGAFRQAKHMGHPAPYRYHAHTQQASSPRVASHSIPKSLAKRVIPNGFSLDNSHVFQLIQPAYLAARGLGRFYDEMLNRAIREWPSLPPSNGWRFRLGAFQLVMVATGTDVVPWVFVAEFAYMMTVMTRMGFTSTYQMVFRDRRGGDDRVILVTMVMQTAAQMAELAGGYAMWLGPT
ncbi:MAG: hypothetical protein Q9204_005377 [Flavoplaca sp. TL-2023a]